MSATIQDGVILKTLQTAVIAALAVSTLPALPVQYVGRSLTPPADQKWLEVIFMPNNPSNGYWGDEKDYMGALRLILHWPIDDEGAYAPIAALSSICAYFSKGLWLNAVKITDVPAFSGMIEGSGELLYPATIRYNSFQPGG